MNWDYSDFALFGSDNTVVYIVLMIPNLQVDANI